MAASDLKDKALWGTVGAVTAALLNMGIFALKSDVSDLRAEMYREFVTRKEFIEQVQAVDKKLDTVGGKLDKVFELLYNLKNKG